MRRRSGRPGGAEGDHRHKVVLSEQLARRGLGSFFVSLDDAIVAPCFVHYGAEELRVRRRQALGEGSREADDRIARRWRSESLVH